MSTQTFNRTRLVLMLCIASIVGISIANGNVILPVIAVSLGVIAVVLTKKRVKEVVEDERAYFVSEKAARKALTVYAPIVAFLTPALIIMGQEGTNDLSVIGYTLGFAACFLMGLYMIFYSFYSRKYGSNAHEEQN